MGTENIFLDDIITDHRERMLNIKKYYPFFKLSQISFATFKEGKYAALDMGYITMAVIRYFIEENNFKDKDVTYPEYVEFMTKCLFRDFGLKLSNEENKEVADFVFDKLKNEGRPFVFEYFDPVDKKKRSLRLRIIESRIVDSTVWYSVSSDAIEFYLDTKEIKDESKINVEQLLLEKLIESKNFKGGIEVVRRINSEVERLKIRKNEVVATMANDVFSGLSMYEQFVETGMKWFEDEQRLFIKNTELIKASLEKAETDYSSINQAEFHRTISDIYELETQLKVAMNKHSELLRACTDLQIMADEIVAKTKLSRLRSHFDFANMLEKIIVNDDIRVLDNLVKPLLNPNLRKSFNLTNIDLLLSYPTGKEEKGEVISNAISEDIVFEDELAEARIRENYCVLMKILLNMLIRNKEFDMIIFNDVVKRICGEKVFVNGDFYSFMVNLCQKTRYSMNEVKNSALRETFLDDILQDMVKEADFEKFEDISFDIELSGGNEERILLDNEFEITNVRFKRIEVF